MGGIHVPWLNEFVLSMAFTGKSGLWKNSTNRSASGDVADDNVTGNFYSRLTSYEVIHCRSLKKRAERLINLSRHTIHEPLTIHLISIHGDEELLLSQLCNAYLLYLLMVRVWMLSRASDFDLSKIRYIKNSKALQTFDLTVCKRLTSHWYYLSVTLTPLESFLHHHSQHDGSYTDTISN